MMLKSKQTNFPIPPSSSTYLQLPLLMTIAPGEDFTTVNQIPFSECLDPLSLQEMLVLDQPNSVVVFSQPKRTRSKTRWPKEVPIPVSYASFVLHKYQPQFNSYRDYRLSYLPGLWEGDQHIVQRSWGRRGSKRPRHLDHQFENAESALAFLKKSVLRRLRRGYELHWWESGDLARMPHQGVSPF